MWHSLSKTASSRAQCRLYRLDLPRACAGRWVWVEVRSRHPPPWWVKIEIDDDMRGHVVREVFLGPARHRFGRYRRATLIYVPFDAGHMRLFVFGAPDDAAFDWRLRICARVAALPFLMMRAARRLPHAWAGHKFGRWGRVRTWVGQSVMRAGEAPPYSLWLQLKAPPDRLPPADDFDVTILVWPGGADETRATLDSIARQQKAGCLVGAAPPAIATAYVLIVKAGEILAPHALAHFARCCRDNPHFDAVFADFDEITVTGERTNPVFRPTPARVGIESGLFIEGAALFAARLYPSAHPPDADAARYLCGLGAGAPGRICDILSHRRQICGLPPPDDLTAILMTRLADKIDRRKSAVHQNIVRVPRLFTQDNQDLVSLIIPTKACSPHVLWCLQSLLARLGDIEVEILLTVSHVDPQDHRQRKIIEEAGKLPYVKILDVNRPAFNYAYVNNAAVRQARGRYLLFMNDDVAPCDSQWLRHMLGHLSNADIVAVGPQLLYGNGDVQHGGVTLGLGGLAEHTARLMTPDRLTRGGQFLAEREVSALTGACLLMRRDDFIAVGGFDEIYAIALNDVDLCLRLGQGGRRLVYAGLAKLWHFEQVSLGRHYKGPRKSQESIEVSRLRAAYEDKIADDIFYHPDASRELGREWQPRFPPVHLKFG